MSKYPKNRKRKYKFVTTIFDLRVDIKAQFKAYCAARGKSMKTVIEEMIIERLKK